MKFRISKKDLIILSVFLVFLLYLCAIGVMNFVTFGSTGTLWGLNPFPAFTGAYLGLTLLLYVVCVIVIFASVSSYVFEKKGKKGIGLVVEDKVETGYSSWAKDKDIKTDRGVVGVDYTAPTVNAAGIPLIYDTKKHKVWVDDGEYHTVVIGASGSGKSQCIVKPLVNLLAKKGESMVITDPKGELYTSAAHRLKELGYNVIVLNFRDPLKGNAWNPLTLPYQYMKMGNMDKATELLDDVALNILYDPNNKGEPFWEKSAADFFSGLALGLFQDAKEEEININSISYMSTVGEERLGPSNYTKEYFTMKGESSSAYTFAANTINAPSDTKGGIMSTFRQKIRLFASRENLSEMLGHSDFSVLDIGRQKTAVFIVIHDEKTTYHALATIFIKQAYETLIDVAQQNGGKLPIRTNFILDEFANMPPLKDVDSMVTAARSRAMRFTFIIQNFAQLNDVYGKEVAEVIRGNCGNTIYLISSEYAALEEISKMCGEVKSKEKDKTASTPLVTVTDLQKFKMGEALLIRTRKGPFKTKLQFDYKTSWGYQQVDEPFPEREAKQVQLFDIKTFVKEKKKEQSLNNPSTQSSNPFGGGALFDNPFGGSPFGASPFDTGASNPFAPSNPFDTKASSANPLGGGLDLDEMLKNIDKKIAELDAEEAKEKGQDNNTLKDTPELNTEDSKVVSNIQPLDLKLDEDETKQLDKENDVSLPNRESQELPEDIKNETKLETAGEEKNNKSNESSSFKIPDLDTLLANLVSDDKETQEKVSNEEIKEAKTEPVKTDINDSLEKEQNLIEVPDTSINNLSSQNSVVSSTNGVKVNDEFKDIILSNDNVKNNNINDDFNTSSKNSNNVVEDSDILLDTPPKMAGGSLRDMLYNPVNANINSANTSENNKFISTPSISEITQNSNQASKENKVIKNTEKPIINVQPEEIKQDNSISDDEFFDDFFGD